MLSAFNADRPSVGGNDRLCDRQAKARTRDGHVVGHARAEEALEQLRLVFGGDPEARVPDLDDRRICRRVDKDVDPTA